MAKFNRSKAEQIVRDVINNHISKYGNVVYEPTGYLPYENGKMINGSKDFPTLRGTIQIELRKVFNYSKTLTTFMNVYMDSIIRKSGIKVGYCRFGLDNTPTYTEPTNINLFEVMDIEVVDEDEMDKLNTFINSI
jgi:hypothetical protein